MSNLSNSEESGHTRAPLPSAEKIAALPPDGGEKYNRLVFEQSPYLLQHAANPVDWWPWSDAAFEHAREQNKPVFLSIGYSTCHWCHVMEHESFENEAVAALMNKYFVPIKVDREERPDIDHLYMTVTQALTGHGGWPMTVLLTPDKKPFFAGTYFPRSSTYGRPGMMELVPGYGEAWEKDKEGVIETGDRIAEALKGMAGGAPGGELGREIMQRAYVQFVQVFDEKYGGFGTRPKFPTPHQFSFLLRYAQQAEDVDEKERAIEMVEQTLEAMWLGGIRDHVGGGFHRYSTDPEWLVPHFEKMLYDQAMIAIAAAELYQLNRNERAHEIAEDIFKYVLRDMQAPEGGFYSAEDADSEGEEGKFYVWTNAEILEILGGEDADLFLEIYNFEVSGNFEDEATHQKTGANIPHLIKPLAEYAQEMEIELAELEERLARMRATLFNHREDRIHPLKDDKVLTDWNGLMIAAFAKGAMAFDEPKYLEAAKRGADFLLAELRDAETGRLYKRWRQGEAGLTGMLEDYAFAVWGLIELYQASLDLKYLQAAVELNGAMIEHFWDDENGAFYMTPDDGEELIVRPKEIYDGATPSGNSVAAFNLARLGHLLGRPELNKKAGEIITAFSKQVEQAPRAHAQLLQALDFLLGPSQEVVIVGDRAAENSKRMHRKLAEDFRPRTVWLHRPAGAASQEATTDALPFSEGAAAVAKLATYTEAQLTLNGAPTAYICENNTCQAPTEDMDTFLANLK